MKKTFFVWGLISISLLAFGLLIFGVQKIEAQRRLQPLQAGEIKAIQTAIAKASSESFWVVSQEFKGSLDKVEEYLNAFGEEFFNQNLAKYLENQDAKPLVIILDNPDQEKEVRMEIGFPLKGGRVSVEKPLKVRQIQQPKSVKYLHTGPHERLSLVYQGVVEGLRTESAQSVFGKPKTEAETAWPVILRIITNPHHVRSKAELKTEVIVPLKEVKEE